MARIASLLCLAALLLSGCSYYWRLDEYDFDPGSAEPLAFDRDAADCSKKAVDAEAGLDVNDYLLVYNEAYRACMHRRGYRERAPALGL